MAESIIFLECTLSEATENYKNVISGGLLEKIQGEEIYKYKNVFLAQVFCYSITNGAHTHANTPRHTCTHYTQQTLVSYISSVISNYY